jgi:hypothetical protein
MSRGRFGRCGTLTSRAPSLQWRGRDGGEQRSSARRRAEEQREEGVRSGGPRLEERGGAWAALGTRGPAEEKEGAGRA